MREMPFWMFALGTKITVCFQASGNSFNLCVLGMDGTHDSLSLNRMGRKQDLRCRAERGLWFTGKPFSELGQDSPFFLLVEAFIPGTCLLKILSKEVEQMKKIEIVLGLTVKGRPQWKKNVFFRALPQSPNPPPPDPNSGNLVLFFWKSKFKI